MVDGLRIWSYPSVYALGHKAVEGILDGEVVVEEKIDGSQFSFGLLGGQLLCRSKGKDQHPDAPDNLFQKATDVVKTLPLRPNYVYRCEYLSKPKHNALAYARTPKNHLIVFDVEVSNQSFLTPAEKQREAERLGLEHVPLIRIGRIENYEAFAALLKTPSVLGGCTVEGVVIKNYAMFTAEKKIAAAKYVSEKFKEVQSHEWKNANPTMKDIIGQIGDSLHTEARWQKAVQHLREVGRLEGSPRDIGPLIREIPDDVMRECADEIKERLFAYGWPHIRRALMRGFPEWYKQELAKSAFDAANAAKGE